MSGGARNGARTAVEHTLDRGFLKVAAQQAPRGQAVGIDLLRQGRDIDEGSFGSLKRHELDEQLRSINVPAEIQNVDFETRRSVVKLGPRSVARYPVRDLAIDENAYGVDAEADAASWNGSRLAVGKPS